MKRMILFLIKFFLGILKIFPINNKKIFFVSYDGNQFSCSPKYIYEEVKKDFKCVWHIKDKSIRIDNTIIVRHKNCRYYYHVLTSKFLITNVNFSSFIPFRKKQCLINTWHGGGAYKYAVHNMNKVDIREKFAKFSCFIGSSNINNELMLLKTFQYNGKILNCGLPRNDIFFKKTSTFKNRIISFFDLELAEFDNSLKVLYAPTFRDYKEDDNRNLFDLAKAKKAFEQKFNRKCIFFVRSHHYGKSLSELFAFDASNYPDMQELLYTMDILITDYSSSMWDFGLTLKPCFLYAYDYEKYDKERSFYTSIYDWGFPVATDNNSFVDAVAKFDYKVYKEKLLSVYKLWGSFEKGNATRTVVDYIKSIT